MCARSTCTPIPARSARQTRFAAWGMARRGRAGTRAGAPWGAAACDCGYRALASMWPVRSRGLRKGGTPGDCSCTGCVGPESWTGALCLTGLRMVLDGQRCARRDLLGWHADQWQNPTMLHCGRASFPPDALHLAKDSNVTVAPPISSGKMRQCYSDRPCGHAMIIALFWQTPDQRAGAANVDRRFANRMRKLSRDDCNNAAFCRQPSRG